LRAKPPFTAFASAKAALRSLAQGLAREFSPAYPIRSVCE
jgi:NAD(P)-dependent dehydrogenase (short-subunit alcohol dehydrogenase family)